MKATEQYFPVVLFVMLYMVVLTFESVDEILKCDFSSESFWKGLSCGAVYYRVHGIVYIVSVDGVVYYAVQGSSNFPVCS